MWWSLKLLTEEISLAINSWGFLAKHFLSSPVVCCKNFIGLNFKPNDSREPEFRLEDSSVEKQYFSRLKHQIKLIIYLATIGFEL